MDQKIVKNKANTKMKTGQTNEHAQAKQLSFSDYSAEFKEYWRDTKKTNRKVHGGTLSIGKRKTARPFDDKKPVHVVLRSSRAKGAYSMLNRQHKGTVNSIVYDHALRCGIRLYNYSNNGNHLHILLRSRELGALQKFLRSIAGIIARKVNGATKGNAKGRFWDALVFTRVSEWGRAFENLQNYVIQNILEAAGAVPYRDRRSKPPPLFYAFNLLRNITYR